MPISSPKRRGRPNLFPPLQACLTAATLALALPLIAPVRAQTLAHPNWVGNGMSTDPWYQHAVIYRIDSTPAASASAGAAPAASSGHVDFRYLLPRIQALRSVGVDALLLPAPEIPVQSAAGSVSGQLAAATDAQNSQIDQLDDLVRVASNRGVRILLTLPAPSGSTDLTGLARFWLNRGIAGFYVDAPAGSNTAEMQATVQLLRRQVASVVGQRIVISGLDLAMPDSSVATQAAAPIVRRAGATHTPRTSDAAPQLELDARLNTLPKLDAAVLRPILSQAVGQPNLVLAFDPAATPTSGRPSPADSKGIAEIRATVSLLTHPASLIEPSARLVLEPVPERLELDDEQPKPAPTPVPQPGVFLPYKPYVAPKKNTLPEIAPKDPLTIWYKQLATLHHGNGAFRSGNISFLNFDAQNALVWVGRPATVTNIAPAIVVACNLSGSEVKLSLTSQIESLGLHGKYLRTLLRSDHAMGPQELDSVTLPPYSVYIGELRR